MRAGVIIPGGTATEQLELAVAAEAAGWDAVLTWETGYGVDPWTVMAAMAVRTERVRLGTMLTPVPWRRPWKLASQVATLDQLSGGRAFVTLGVGALSDELTQTGEVTDLRERAARMDEAIDVLRSLWTGSGEHHGTYYDVTCSEWLRRCRTAGAVAAADLGGRRLAATEVDAPGAALRRRLAGVPPGRPRRGARRPARDARLARRAGRAGHPRRRHRGRDVTGGLRLAGRTSQAGQRPARRGGWRAAGGRPTRSPPGWPTPAAGSTPAHRPADRVAIRRPRGRR